MGAPGPQISTVLTPDIGADGDLFSASGGSNAPAVTETSGRPPRPATKNCL